MNRVILEKNQFTAKRRNLAFNLYNLIFLRLVRQSPLVIVKISDGLSTMVMGGRQVKVLAWYDNEWGY
ncbi:type I glyceraldehyde-3-phosphate dehydrogenase, partial [Exiguobacterium artemiae]|nr:type I glyceraldehyde-3-phosphate dehydrogenase [Exiguobacterium artemiae]